MVSLPLLLQPLLPPPPLLLLLLLVVTRRCLHFGCLRPQMRHSVLASMFSIATCIRSTRGESNPPLLIITIVAQRVADNQHMPWRVRRFGLKLRGHNG